MDPSPTVNVSEAVCQQMPLWTNDVEYRRLFDLINETSTSAEERLFELWKIRSQRLADWTLEERNEIMEKWFGPVENWTVEESIMFSLDRSLIESHKLADQLSITDHHACLLQLFGNRMNMSTEWTQEEGETLLKKYLGHRSKWTKLERHLFCADADLEWDKEAPTLLGLESSDALPSVSQKEALLHAIMPNCRPDAWICGWNKSDLQNIAKADSCFIQECCDFGVITNEKKPDKKNGTNEVSKKTSKSKTSSEKGSENISPAGETGARYCPQWNLEERKDLDPKDDECPIQSEVTTFRELDSESQWKYINEKFDRVPQLLKKGKPETTKLKLHYSMFGNRRQ